MLLRSTSAPILNSAVPPSPEPPGVGGSDLLLRHITRTGSINHLPTSLSFPHCIDSTTNDNNKNKNSNSNSGGGRGIIGRRRILTRRVASEHDLSILLLLPPPLPKHKLLIMPSTSIHSGYGVLGEKDHDDGEEEEEEEGEKASIDSTSSTSSLQVQQLDRLLSSSGLMDASSSTHLLLQDDGCCTLVAATGGGTSTPAVLAVVGEGCAGSGGGNKICGGGGGGGGGADHGCDGFGFSDSDKITDAYYQKMIQADPGNSLILGNYAKFLKEVEGNLNKAEEYCERAILVGNQGDGGVLSMYADIIWEKSKDAQRAETYFHQAVAAAPDDSYIMASYARFLWDAEEEDDEEDMVTSTGILAGGLQRIHPGSAQLNRNHLSYPSIAAAS